MWIGGAWLRASLVCPQSGLAEVQPRFSWVEAPRMNYSHYNPNVNTQNKESFSTRLHTYDPYLRYDLRHQQMLGVELTRSAKIR